jgi:ATP-binding cassette, subfamily B, bacterial
LTLLQYPSPKSRLGRSSPNAWFGPPAEGTAAAGIRVRRAFSWLRGFGRPIAKVLAVALVLAAATAAAPLAVMKLVDALGRVAAQVPQSGTVAPAALRSIVIALALLALAELAQVMLTRLLEAKSWRVRLDLDFALRQRVTARLHQLPLTYRQQQTVGGIVRRVNTSIDGFVAAVAELAFKALPAMAYLGLAFAALLELDWRGVRFRSASGADRHARGAMRARRRCRGFPPRRPGSRSPPSASGSC